MNAPLSPAERQHRISEIAHRIWESEGRPSGHALRHWQMAEKLVQAKERQDVFNEENGENPSASPNDHHS